jgi:NAD(P)-dependent dehydrogenase (short-subunit alcohol dehydrogenase family)
VITDLEEDGARQSAAGIEAAGGRAFAHRFDVTRQADIDELARTVAERPGGVDILLNNAGVSTWSAGP